MPKGEINKQMRRNEAQARREGRFNRAESWSPNGEKNCHKRQRRHSKQSLRDFY